MKNFLKSTAIFVCAALMMGACTKEETEDVGGDYVPAPVIESLLPGNEKAVLTWYNPDTNENVSKCQISWVGPNDVKGATIQTITKLGASQEYSIMNEKEPLAAGAYTVTIKALATTGDSSETLTEEVTIYDSSSYETPEVVATEAIDGVVTLKWGDIHEDCDSIRISYYDEYGIVYYTLVDDFETESELVTSLEGAAYETQITYNAFFIPEGGYDYVIKAGSYSIANIPEAPVNAVAKGGLNRFTVGWEITAEDISDLDYALITYTKVVDDEETDEEETTEEETTDEETTDEEVSTTNTVVVYTLNQGENSYEISGVENGDYDVTVQIYNKSGFSSSADDMECNVVTVYGTDSYDVAPVAYLVNVNGVITISFDAEDVVEDCTGLSVTYQKSSSATDTATVKVDLDADISSTGMYSISISDGYGTSPITVTGTFSPSGEYTLGDVLIIDQLSEYTLPELAPAAPTSQTVTLDFNASASWMDVSWTLGDTENVSAVRVYYTEDGYVEFTDLNTTSCSFSTADEDAVIEVNTAYTVEVKTVSTGGMTSEPAESFIAKPYNYSSHTNNDLPTPTVSTEMNEAGNGVVVLSWADVHEDLKVITVTYAGKEYTYTPNEDGEMIVTEDIAFVVGEMTYTFNATFYPDGGLTQNVVVNSAVYSFDMTDVTPAAPSTLTTITGLTDAGGSKVTASWTIDDATNVTDMYVFYCDESDTTRVQYVTSDAIEAGDYSLVIEDLATGTADSLVTYSFYAMTYNAAIDTYSDSSDVLSDVAPYIESGYFTAPKISSIDYVDGVMTITWGSTSYSGLTKVAVSYQTKDSSGAVTTATEEIMVYTGTIADLLITGAIPGTAVTYVASFLPTGGEDVVEVDSTVSYYVPSAASDFTFQAGVVYENNLYSPVVRVSWSLEDASSASKLILYYKESTASSYTEMSVDLKESGATYEEVIYVGYSGRVYNGYIGVIQSDGSTEYTTAVETVTTYGTVDYLNTVIPTVDSSNNIWSGSVLTVVWTGFEGIEDLYSIDIMNGDEVLLTTMYADLANGTTFDTSLLDNPSEFVYNVNFIPEGGADFVVRSSTYNAAEGAIPSNPAYLKDFVTGYDEAGAYVKVFVDVDNDDNFLEETVFEFTESGALLPTYSVAISDYDALEGDGYKVYASDETIKVDTDYEVKIYNLTEYATPSLETVEIESLTRLYNEATYVTVPTSVDMDIFGEYLAPTFNDLYGETILSSITYNEVAYEVEFVDGVAYSAGTEDEFEIPVESYVDGNNDFSYEINIRPSAGETTTTITGSNTLVYSCGYNAEDEVYEIYNVRGLEFCKGVINGTISRVTKDNTINCKLMDDIDLSTVCSADLGNWTPIGASTGTAAYYGTFDGNGKVISNLYIYDTSLNYQALFGYISGATIKDLTVDSPNVTGVSMSSAIVSRTAASSLVENCYVTGTGTITGSSNNCGNIAGYNQGNIINCHVGSGITIYGVSTGTGNGGAGGIAGGSTSGTYIVGCTNASTVTCAGRSGGIVAYSNGVYIIGCANTGSVTDLNGSTGNIGGIGGRFIGGTVHFIGCYNTGTVTSNNKTQTSGIMGVSTSTITMAGCYNIGDINAGTATTDIGALQGYSGGTYTFTADYYIPTTNMSWASYSAATEDPSGTYKLENIAALNSVVDEMNAAIIAAGYDSSSEYFYQYTVGADPSVDYPTISAVE